MANLPEDIGIPSVEPQTEGIDVRANPNAFGAAIGEGLQQLGAGVAKYQDFQNETAANDAANALRKKQDAILQGDPDDPNSTGYYNLHGLDAINAHKQMVQDLDKAEQDMAATLPSQRARLMYEQQTRRDRWLVDQQTSTYLQQQKHNYQVKSNQDTIDIAENRIAQSPEDPYVLAQAFDDARNAYSRTMQLNEGSGFNRQAAIDKADQHVRLIQVEALRVKDPQKALDLLNSDGGAVLRTLPNYASLYHQVQEDAANGATAKTTDQNITKWKGEAGAAVNPAPATQAPDQSSQPDSHAIQETKNWVDERYVTPVSAIIRGETPKDPTQPNPDANKHVAGAGQFTVDQWKTVTGQTIRPEDINVPGRDPRLDVTQSVVALGKEADQNRNTYVATFGREPTDGDLAVMHQQGTAGAMKLFGALGTSPNAPAANYVSADALTKNHIPANATVAQAVRGISDYYGKGRTDAANDDTPAAQELYTSQSDFLNAHVEDAINDYRKQIEANPAFENRPDLVDRSVNSFETQYRRTIRDQNAQYVTDMHTVQSLVAGGHMTSWNDVMATSPQAAATAMRLMWENPAAYHEMDNWFKANAGGAAKTMGAQFDKLFDRVMAPAGDPNRITDPKAITSYIGPGENSLLTNTGAGVLNRVLNARNQPGGENNISQLRNFFSSAKKLIDPLSNADLGQTWPEGQQKYSRFVNSALQEVQVEMDKGEPMSAILKKGGTVDTMLGAAGATAADLKNARQHQKIVQDPRLMTQVKARQYLARSADLNYLQTGITDKTITPAQAAWQIWMSARNPQQLKEAYDKKMITWDQVDNALKHLQQYRRNFYGQPAQ